MTKEIFSIVYRGVPTNDKSEIQSAFFAHYRDLFRRSDTTAQVLKLQDLLARMPCLSDLTKHQFEEPYSLEDVEDAVDALPAQKYPGLGGTIPEFYRRFKSIVCPILLEYFHYAYEPHFLHSFFLQCHTILIPKSEDAEKLSLVSGYRSIKLSNVDYKTFAKILSNCL